MVRVKLGDEYASVVMSVPAMAFCPYLARQDDGVVV